MGTTLTGTTPQDTYDSLIKVTDNGPLSGTAKYLSDGLGNDSVLALSTAVVGINTSSPNTSYPLSVASASNANAIAVFGRASDNTGSIDFYQSNGSSRILEFGVSTTQVDIYNDLNTPMLFSTNATERMRITGAGNVGIGTSSPAQKLTVYRNDSGNVSALIENAFINQGNLLQFNQNTTSGTVTAYIGHGGDATGSLRFFNGGAERVSITTTGVLELAQGQIKFPATQVASADANTLDDYEEGTFTPTFTPASGAYGTLTYGTTDGKYTKIGNRVDFSLRVTITAYSAGSASGLLQLGNLPFTCATGYVGSVSMSLVDDFAANRYPIKGFVNDTTNYILLRYMTAFNTNEAYVSATDITASSTIRISGTYFTA